MFVDAETIGMLLPECILVAAATCIYLCGALVRGRAVWALFAAAALAAACTADLCLLLGNDWAPWNSPWDQLRQDQSGPLAIDFLSFGVRWLVMLAGLLLVLVSWRGASRELASEYLGTLLLVVVGAMLVARANELVLLFVGLELVSIPVYVLLMLGGRGGGAFEATVKYFFLSVFSSALLLYGFSFLYGLCGATSIAGEGGIRESLLRLQGEGSAQWNWLAPVALVLILAGLGFKIAAVPFHFYAPDVYQGTTNANAGLLAVAPKIAGVAAIVRLVVVAIPVSAPFAWRVAVVLAALTMTLGNVCALWQSNIRRLMAYSSIAHAGYMLIGLAVAMGAMEAGVVGCGGVAAMLLYLLVYVLAVLGTFAALTHLGSEDREVDRVDELAGLARVRPFAAGAIGVFMFSLAGIPPLAGFWGKLALLAGAVNLATANSELWFGFAFLAVIGAVNVAIAAAYYLRIVAVMYFRAGSPVSPARGGWSSGAATATCALLVVLVGVMPAMAVRSAATAEQSLQLGKGAAAVSASHWSATDLAERPVRP